MISAVPEFVLVDENLRADFISAWECAFQRSLGSEVYNWIFNDTNLLYAALIDGEVAAGYCLYPLRSVWRGRDARVLMCNNVFVHPKHQGKHLFVRLARFTLSDATAKGYEIAYGLPNRSALPGHKRVGWRVHPPIVFLKKARNSAGAISSVLWETAPLSAHLREDIERCSARASVGREFSIIKSAELVQWRYEEKPGTLYWFGFRYHENHLLAYCVCKFYKDDNVLHFIDIDGHDASAIKELIVAAEDLALPFDYLNVWSSSVHATLFESAGYTLDDSSNNFITIGLNDGEAPALGKKFNLVLADNDVF